MKESPIIAADRRAPGLPAMRMVRQRFSVPPAVNVAAEIEREWVGIKNHLNLPPGASVAMVLSRDIEAVETELLRMARDCLPTLPLKEIDLLIIDEMGKDISGEGIDPCVVGRDMCAYGVARPWPKITRIFVRDLTPGSEGSAIGVSQADFTTQRLVDKIDMPATLINCLTACAPEMGKIPFAFPNDREAIALALKTLRPCSAKDVRLVHIKNTMELTSMLVSTGCLEALDKDRIASISEEDLELTFDALGNLTPLSGVEGEHPS